MLDVAVVGQAVLKHDFGLLRFFNWGVGLCDWLLDWRNVWLGGRQANGVLVDVLDWELLKYPCLELASYLSMAALFARISHEPILLQQLVCCHPCLTVHIEHLLEQVQAIIREVTPDELEHSALYPPVQLCVSLALEREEAIKQREEQDATGPYVSGRAVVLYARNYLRCHVGRRSTEQFDFPLRSVAR